MKVISGYISGRCAPYPSSSGSISRPRSLGRLGIRQPGHLVSLSMIDPDLGGYNLSQLSVWWGGSGSALPSSASNLSHPTVRSVYRAALCACGSRIHTTHNRKGSQFTAQVRRRSASLRPNSASQVARSTSFVSWRKPNFLSVSKRGDAAEPKVAATCGRQNAIERTAA